MIRLDAIRTRVEGRVLFATLDVPPLNLIGPEIARNLVTLVQRLESDEDDVAVVVFGSAVPDFFSAHVDMAQIPAMRSELARLTSDGSLVMLFHRISTLKQVTIAQIAGRVHSRGCAIESVGDRLRGARTSEIVGSAERESQQARAQ